MRRPPVVLALTAVALASLAVRAAAADPRAAIGPSAERAPGGLWSVRLEDGLELLTHGPDPVPNHGGSVGPGDPERQPACATDDYQHVLYGRLTSSADRLAQVRDTIRATIRRMNAVLNDEAMASGGRTADYKVLCDAGAIRVDGFTAGAYDFESVVAGARAAGHTLPNADYTIFFDAQPGGVCGIGSYYPDERLVESNYNNSGGDYAVVYNQCWTNETAMHENGHNQGAVQYNAPYSTGSGAHCVDENDVMCYSPDGGDQNQGGTVSRCTDAIHYDCGYDSYFDAAPEPGEYLEAHWNIGSTLNRFIAFGAPGVIKPSASFAYDCTGLTCTFTDTSVDQDGTIDARAWDFGDGATSSAAAPTHTFEDPGNYTVTLTVTDDDDEAATAATTLTVPEGGDPDPSTPTLRNGQPEVVRSAPRGGWKYFKIYVPGGNPTLRVALDGPSCVAVVCNPDLDLYVRFGSRPTTDEWTCAPQQFSADEVCTIATPAQGYWYVGAYTFLAVTQGTFRLTATY